MGYFSDFSQAQDLIDKSMQSIVAIGSSATGSDLIINDSGTSYVAQTYTAGKIKISAANAADTSGGTGARTVRLYGLDSNFNEQYEDLSLNGQTAVETTKNFVFVYRLEVLTAGTNGQNAGIIYAGTGIVTTGVPATQWLSIIGGAGVSRGGVFVVPAGYTMFIKKGVMNNATATNPCVVKLFTTGVTAGSKVQRLALTVNGLSTQDLNIETSVPEKTLVSITGNNATSTSVMRVALNYRLIKN